MRTVRARPGDPAPRLFLRGDHLPTSPADQHFGVITRGLVSVMQVGPQGRTAVIDLLGPGSTLGELALIEESQSDTQVVRTALAPTLVRWSPAPPPEIAPDPEIVATALAVVANRARRAQTRALRRRSQTAAQRLADLLPDLWFPIDDEGAALSRLTRQDLATVAATTRSVACRTWRNFEERGWITTGGGEVIALEVEELHRFADRGVPPRLAELDDRLRRHQRRLAGLVAARDGDWVEGWVEGWVEHQSDQGGLRRAV